jgi:hypothetical protein
MSRGWWKAGLMALVAIVLTMSAFLEVQAIPQEKGDISNDGLINVVDVSALGDLVAGAHLQR